MRIERERESRVWNTRAHSRRNMFCTGTAIVMYKVQRAFKVYLARCVHLWGPVWPGASFADVLCRIYAMPAASVRAVPLSGLGFCDRFKE